MTKTWSCESLHHAVYAAPDVLRHCCKRFFVDGEMKGDVEILSVASDSDISYENIRTKKAELYQEINKGKETPCTGCPWLVKRDWPSLDQLNISLISIEHHSVCNLRCTYCSDIYYGGKKPSYDVQNLFDNLSNSNAISSNLSLIWGGGEPVIFGGFDRLFSHMADRYEPVNNHVFTNAIKFSDILETYLKLEKVILTVSLDAGTPETFKLVRGRSRLNQVLENLRRYHQAGKDRVIIKYILMPENSSENEVQGFIENIKNYNLEKCSFQISADFKDEVVSQQVVDAAKYIFKELRTVGTEMINFDYHLRPRVQKSLLDGAAESAQNQPFYEDLIVWGAGEYALRLLENELLSKKIKFFVDGDTRKHGEKIGGFEIHPPKAVLAEQNPLIFVASSQFYSEICHEIIEMGLTTENILETNFF